MQKIIRFVSYDYVKKIADFAITLLFFSVVNAAVALDCNPPPYLELNCIEHKVLKNEIISKIAYKYYGTVREKPVSKIIMDFNDIKDETKVLVGTKILIPQIQGLQFPKDTKIFIPQIQGLQFPKDTLYKKIKINCYEQRYRSLIDALGYCSDQSVHLGIPIIHVFDRSKIQIFSVADGLPANGTLCVDQDREGNLWIGTFLGVSRFDGSIFTNFGPKNGFVNDYAWAILGDEKGNVWVGTQRNGLFRYGNDKWKQYRKSSPYSNLHNFEDGFLFQDSKGGIWGGGYLIDFFKIYKDIPVPINFNDSHMKIQDVAENAYDNHIYAIEAFQLTESTNTGFQEFTNKSNIRLLKIPENSSYDGENIINISKPYLRLKDMPKGIAFNQNRKIYILEDKNLTCSFLNTSYSWEVDEFNEVIRTLPNSTARHIMIDLKNYVWVAYHDYIIHFKDKSKINVYRYEDGLPEGRYYYVFQDRTGHIWFCSKNGLAKYDNIPPTIQVIDEIPQIIRTSSFSFRITGNDGKLGSPVEDIIYDYRIISEEKSNNWVIAENGIVNIDNLQENIDYQLILRATDGFQNATKKQLHFKVRFDTKKPKITIVNKNDFLHPLKSNNFAFDIIGQDDITPDNELFYRYKLDKEDEKVSTWSNQWSREVKEVLFENMKSGEYTFHIQVRNNLGNITNNKLHFTVLATEDRPKIKLESFNSCYFTEENNKPFIKHSLIDPQKAIPSGRIEFIVKNIDDREDKQSLQYAVQLSPLHRTWTTYRSDNRYEFSDLPDGEYLLKVRAKDSAELISLPLEYSFAVKGFNMLPQTEILFEGLGRGKIVGRIPEICWKPVGDSKEEHLYSYKLDNDDWSEFFLESCFEFPTSQSARHSFQVIAKSKYGIEPMPAKHEFDYERIHDLPMIKLTSKPSKIIFQRFITFTFEGQDDMEHGDKTKPEEIQYSWRLIPVDNGWNRISPQNKVTYLDLPNGTYFFQVKAVDKNENECVVPAEHYFEVKVVPFYQKPFFYWTSSICVTILAAFFSIFFTRRQTRKNLYEQRYNPYIVGEAVHDPEMFFGRDTLIRDLFGSLSKNSLCITGERRIGKTSLMEHLEKNTQKPQFSFFCNLEGVKEELFFSRIMQHLINKIQASFLEAPVELNLLFQKERKNYDDVDFEYDIEIILDWLKSAYSSQVSIVMCLDEIDATQYFSNDTHSSLRNIFQTYQGKIRLVAAGVSIQRGNWHQPTSPWYNFFEFISVPPLDSRSSRELITKPVQGFYKFDPSAIDLIMKKTDYKPFYVQRICKKVVSKILDEKRHKVTSLDVEKVYNDMIHLELNREFEQFWEELSHGLRGWIVQSIHNELVKLSKPHELELMNNPYNHAHRVMTICERKIEFSTMFKDWLMINYVESKGYTHDIS